MKLLSPANLARLSVSCFVLMIMSSHLQTNEAKKKRERKKKDTNNILKLCSELIMTMTALCSWLNYDYPVNNM